MVNYKENLEKVISEMATALPEMSDVARDWCIEDVITPIAVISLKMQADAYTKAWEGRFTNDQDANLFRHHLHLQLIGYGLIDERKSVCLSCWSEKISIVKATGAKSMNIEIVCRSCKHKINHDINI